MGENFKGYDRWKTTPPEDDCDCDEYCVCEFHWDIAEDGKFIKGERKENPNK